MATVFDVLVDSKKLPAGSIVAFVVDLDLNQPGMCVVTLRNIDPEQNNSFKLGTTVEVNFDSGQSGNSQTTIKMFKGELVGIEPSYAQGGERTLSLRAFDKLHRLQRVRRSAVYENQTDQDIASAIASRHQLSALCGSTPKIKHEHIYQPNQTDLEFLLVRADRIGYSVWCEDTKLYFDALKLGADSGLHFVYGRKGKDTLELVSFAARLSNALVVKKVIVRGWNSETKKEFVGEANAKRSPLGSSIAASSLGDFDAVTTYNVDHPIFSVEEATALANARLAESALSFLTAEAEAMGNTGVKPGIVVKVTVNEANANDRFNGKYLVQGCTHRYVVEKTAAYTTTMRLARNAEK
jgi:phage protein D